MSRGRKPRPEFVSEADERDVPCQSLIKVWLAERLAAEDARLRR